MIAVRIEFLTGRFHGTPWGRHVNEGEVEWPPSPWRFLRALAARWHAASPTTSFADADVANLVSRLAEVLPSYRLPPAAFAHTRHYMPQHAPGKTSLVIDAFADVRDEPVWILWPELELDARQEELLDLLLASTTYLGRAESWVEIQRTADAPEPNVCPVSDDSSERESVQLMAPLPPTELAAWAETTRGEMREALLQEERAKQVAKGKDPAKVKLTPKKLAAIEIVPDSVWGALAASTAELQQSNQRWSAPPGTRMVDYAIERPNVHVSRHGRTPTTRPTVARFAVASAVPPHITDAMSVADRLHRTLVSHSATPVFTGCEADNKTPLTGNDHAYVLPEVDARRSERIRFLTVVAKMGFDEDEETALQRVSRLWGRDGHDLQLVYLGMGAPEDFAGPRAEAGHSTILSSARTWRSLTPFVATRHARKKRSGEPRLDEHGDPIGSPRHDMIRLLAEQGLPRPAVVKDLGRANVAGKSMPWSRWKTDRPNGSGKRSVTVGTGFEITFDKPVTGPIAVGYGAHFGLGLFVPIGFDDGEG